jgi:hypothetical protein
MPPGTDGCRVISASGRKAKEKSTRSLPGIRWRTPTAFALRRQEESRRCAVAYVVAIDPLALILSGQVYVRLTLPDPPPIDELNAHIHELVGEMGSEETRYALARAKALGAYARALEDELSKG